MNPALAGRWVAVVDCVAEQPLAAPLRFSAFIATGEAQVQAHESCANGLRETHHCTIRVTPDERNAAVLVQAYDAGVEAHWYGADTQALKILDHRVPTPVGSFVLSQ